MNNIRREEAVIYNQGSEIPLVIERNSRAKRIRLKINRSGRAVLILPVRASRRAGLLFAGSKSDWIADQLRRLPQKNVFHDGMSFSFLGRSVVIHHSPAARRGVWLAGDVIWVSGQAEHLPRRVLDFLKKEFAAYALKKAREEAARIQTNVQKVTVRDTVSRWGSCSKSGHLNFSWRLGLAPLFVTDYVIAHEVSHLVQMNHSAAFWQIVGELCPEYRKAEQWLKKNTTYLYSFAGSEKKN